MMQLLSSEIDENIFKISLFDMLRFLKTPSEQGLDQFFRGVKGDDVTTVHDGDAIAQYFGFVHIMSRQDDGDAAVTHFANEIPEVAASLRVETGGWFVEEEYFGVVYQSGNDTETLFLAAREMLNIAVGFVAEVDFVEELTRVDALTIGCREELDQLSELGFILKAWSLRLDSDNRANFVWLTGDINAIDRGATAVDGAQRLDHLKGGGFAGAVWPEDTENFTFVDAETNAINDFFAIINFLEVFDFENCFIFFHSFSVSDEA